MSKYSTAMGKNIDMAALKAQNEKVRAVGNMNVNARGDVLDSHGNVIHDNNKRVSGVYNNTIDARAMASDVTGTAAPAPQPVIAAKPVATKTTATKAATKPKIDPDELTELEREFEQLDEDTDQDNQNT
jgi:hypothetical protein